MSFLTIAGIPVPASPSGVKENAIERIGSTSRAFSGGLRSTVRDEKRSWSVQTRPLTSSEEAPLRSAIAGGGFVTVSGDLLGNVDTLCDVAIADATAVKVTGGFRNQLTFAITEV